VPTTRPPCVGRLCWLLILAFIALTATAQPLTRDADYRLIPRQPLEIPERTEVIDFFFYACPHCNELEPFFERWLQRKPADVVFRRVPVVRHDSWAPLAKIYYTLEAIGEVGRLHGAVYRAYHVDRLAINQEDVIADWAEKHGIPRDKFMAIYRGDETRKKVERARRMTLDYDIQSTPSIVVDGRYLTSSGMTNGVPQVIPALDALILLVRQQRLEKNVK